jgi:hypothetical protein
METMDIVIAGIVIVVVAGVLVALVRRAANKPGKPRRRLRGLLDDETWSDLPDEPSPLFGAGESFDGDVGH